MPIFALKRLLRPLLTALLLLPVSSLALADDLGNAKAAGLIGEQITGYLGVVTPSASPQVRALMDEINARRRAEYERIAARNGIAVGDVEKLAGGKAIERSAAGEFVNPGGGWRQK